MAYASYLFRNRHRTYYLRYTPSRLFSLKNSSLPHGGNEMPPTVVRLSLGTKRRPVAQILSRALVAAIEDHIMTNPTPVAPSDIQTLIRAKLPELKVRLQLEKVEEAHVETLDRLIEERHQHQQTKLQRNTLVKGLHEANGARKALEDALRTSIVSSSPITHPEPLKGSSATIAAVVDEFVKEHQSNWSPATLKKNAPLLRVLVQILGSDLPVAELNYDRVRHWKKEVMTLPAHMNSAANKGKTIAALRQAATYRPISAKTQQDHFVLASQLGKWAKTHGYLSDNYFDGLKPKRKKSSPVERSFDEQRLSKLFGTQNELYGTAEHVIRTRNPEDHHFWIPLLAAFTGGRINELCQLHVEDVQEREGVWGIYINDDATDKRLKAAASKRFVPLHSYLIKAGFLPYVEFLKRRGERRLFPALSLKECGGYATQTSAWCSEFFKRSGVKAEAYKDSCHSLRHTFINRLKQNGVAEPYITELAGHEHTALALNRYSSSYKPSLMQPIVEGIHYDFMDENQITYDQWKASRRSAKR
jgi:integrase